MKSYKDLDIYTIGLELFYRTHTLSLQLPKYELYELGSQIRRSSDSVISNELSVVGCGFFRKEITENRKRITK